MPLPTITEFPIAPIFSQGEDVEAFLLRQSAYYKQINDFNLQHFDFIYGHGPGTQGRLDDENINIGGLSHDSLGGITTDNHHPKLHGADHEDDGIQEISVEGLLGLLADLQNVLDHNHESIGSGAGGKLDHGLAMTTASLLDNDHDQYALLTGANQPFTGNLEISKAAPELRLTDTGDSNYTRLVRTDTLAQANRLNIVNQAATDDRALALDGINDDVDIDSVRAGMASATTGTFLFWVKVVEPPNFGNGILMSFGDTDAGSFIRLVAFRSGENDNRFLADCRIGGADKWTLITDNVVFDDNSWHLLTLIHDGTAPVLLVDASVVAQTFTVSTDKTIWFSDIPGLDNGYLGVNQLNSAAKAFYLEGIIDEFAIWSRDLALTDITEVWNSGAGLRLNKDDNFTVSGTSMGLNLECLFHIDETAMNSAPGGADLEDFSGNDRDVSTNGSMTDGDFVTGKVVESAGGDTEARVWQSEDGVSGGEKGKQSYGDPTGRTTLAGKTLRFNIGGNEKGQMDTNGDMFFAGKLGIGMTSAPEGVLEVNVATAQNVGVIFQTTDDDPTNNLTEWQSATGVAQTYVDGLGRLCIQVGTTYAGCFDSTQAVDPFGSIVVLTTTKDDGRSVLRVRPNGTDTRGLIQISNSSDDANAALFTTLTRSNIGLFATANIGTPAQIIDTIAIEIDGINGISGEKFQIGVDGFFDIGSPTILFQAQQTTTAEQVLIESQAIGATPLLLKGAVNQSASLLKLQNSAGQDYINTGKGLAGSEFVGNAQRKDIDWKWGGNGADGLFFDAANIRFGVGTETPVEAVTVNGNINLPKTSGNGIKIDGAASTFGWRDLEGFEIPDPTGGDRPTLSTYSGGSIKENAFSNGDVLRIRYHIPHDYVKGTDIFSHIHWSHNGTAISGNVVFGVTSDYAKGHNQANFGTEKAISITYDTVNISTTPQRRQRIEESAITSDGGSATLIDRGLLEPDGIILVTFEVTTNPTITGGSPNNVFVHRADLHYQSTNIATKDKAPDFYT